MEKLYVVIRSDLPVGLRHAQIAHAALKFAHDWPELESAWYQGSNNIVILTVDDEPALCALYDDAEARSLAAAPFLEPDLGDAMTAVALESGAKRLVCKLKLAS